MNEWMLAFPGAYVEGRRVVTFYVGQKTVLLNNYVYGFNMVCHL